MKIRVCFLYAVLLIFSSIGIYAQESQIEPRHSVALEEIIIDDFSNFSDRFLPYPDADQDKILRARDRQRPFCDDSNRSCFAAIYEDATSANELLQSDDLVLGYVTDEGNSYAFPFAILVYHGTVNTTIDNEPIVVTYCLQCNSAAVFSREVEENTLEFGNSSAYYQNINLLYDVQTDSLWLAPNGNAIVGEYTSKSLTPLPYVISTWQDWQSAFPDTNVLARQPQYTNYSVSFLEDHIDRLNLGRFTYPISRSITADDRLSFAEPVLVVHYDDKIVAYPLATTGASFISDQIGEDQIVIFIRHLRNNRAIGQAYRNNNNGNTLELTFDEINVTWSDQNSNQTFNYFGESADNNSDDSLELVRSEYIYWFAALVLYPELELHQGTNP